MKVIDADAHVEECTETWKYLDQQFYTQRPIPVTILEDTSFGVNNAFWLIEGKVFPKIVGPGAFVFGTPATSEAAKRKPFPIGAQTLEDVSARLADMSRMGIDTQIIFPTLFLVTLCDSVPLEVALCRSYNTWMADVCRRANGRLRYSAVMPLRDVKASVEELRRTKDAGAVAATALGSVWEKNLTDKVFYPFWEQAERLNIPVCIHFGWSFPALTNFYADLANSSFSAAALPVIMAFHSIISSRLLDEFPRLKLAFLEVGSEWLPYAVHKLDRRYRNSRASLSSFSAPRKPSDYLKNGNIYVACETDEDINHVLTCIGEDQLVIASDYPHSDPSREEDLVGALNNRTDVPAKVREKILCHNPARLYEL